MARNDKTLRQYSPSSITILEAIGEAAVGAGDLLEIFLSVPYGTSMAGFEYRIAQKQRERAREKLRDRELVAARRRYYNLISWLKRDKMIKERISATRKILSLTEKGRERLGRLQARALLPSNTYEHRAGERLVIIMFDIPERDRHKRDWLRCALQRLGCAMLQKSVWAGKVKIPKQFLDDLATLRIIEFVEIFEITKTGSLHHLA